MKVIKDFGTVEPFAVMIPRHNFTMGFAALISESQVWNNGMTGVKADCVQIFTEGFKLNRAVGEGTFSESLGISRFIRPVSAI